MKTKFKDFLLYSLACVGAVSLFLSAYQPQQTTSTVPESHVWDLVMSVTSTDAYIYNKKTYIFHKNIWLSFFSHIF